MVRAEIRRLSHPENSSATRYVFGLWPLCWLKLLWESTIEAGEFGVFPQLAGWDPSSTSAISNRRIFPTILAFCLFKKSPFAPFNDEAVRNQPYTTEGNGDQDFFASFTSSALSDINSSASSSH